MLNKPFNLLKWDNIVERVRACKNKILLTDLELIENIKHAVSKKLIQANEKITKKVYRNFKEFTATIENELIVIESNLEHISNIGFRIQKDAAKGICNIEFYG